MVMSDIPLDDAARGCLRVLEERKAKWMAEIQTEIERIRVDRHRALGICARLRREDLETILDIPIEEFAEVVRDELCRANQIPTAYTRKG